MKATFLKIIALFSIICISSCDKATKKPGTIPIKTYSNIKLGNDNNPNYGSFINLKTGNVYSLNQSPKGIDNQNEVDLVYFYNTVNHGDPYLAAPTEVQSNAYNGNIFTNNPNGLNFWSNLHNTAFSSAPQVSVGAFDNIDNYQELKDAVEEVYGNYEYNVHSERIYKFKTWDNKIGLLRINTINGNGQISATMDIDIKVQE